MFRVIPQERAGSQIRASNAGSLQKEDGNDRHRGRSCAAVLERQARAFSDSLKAAEPAYDRLARAGYPGTDPIGSDWGELADGLDHVIEGLELLRLADGDQGAADFFYFVGKDRKVQKMAKNR